MSFHLPDKFLTRVSKIDIKKDLIDKDIKSVLMDVDNTVLTRDNSIIPDDIKKWIENLKKAGLNICLISNDWHDNVINASNELKLPIVVKSLKPLPHSFIMAMRKIGAKKKNTIMIGDQLLTDVFGAHLIGLKCILVLPLVKKDLIHTLILRKFEKLILHGKQPDK